MTDWNAVEHAYGKASDLADLLHRMTPDPRSEVWGELWSRLCHQGTVYPASFAALPHLLEAARQWAPKDRGAVLAIAGSIVARHDQSLQFLNVRRLYSSEIESFIGLSEETLAQARLDWAEFVFILQAWLGFKDVSVWKIQFDRLVDGEFETLCPNCHTELLVVVGPDKFFAAEQDYIVVTDAKLSPLLPLEIQQLSGTGKILYEMAVTAKQNGVADQIRYLFGNAKCPHCDISFSIPDSIISEQEMA